MKKKLLYITPHLSTGGLPQYLLKKIEVMIHHFDVYCLEWDNITGGVFVVQREKIAKMLGNKLITMNASHKNMASVIREMKPDIVHLEEIPELFMPEEAADIIYSPSRNYIILETSHASDFDITFKRYLPDKFLMVSQHQVDRYKPLGVPVKLVEYPIEYKTPTKTREQALLDLGLDPSLKHVIMVGLFTPNKNQSEAIEYARQLQHYPIQFHFIGNQAENFSEYWKPLMNSLPSNCKCWGERSDVDAFYEAADLFLFTSLKETMPLVVREAIGWRIPSLIFNLPTYNGYFDAFDTIEYLSDDAQANARRIAEKLTVEYVPRAAEVITPVVDDKNAYRMLKESRRAYVICAVGQNYINNTETLVQALYKYSKYPVILFYADGIVRYNYGNLITQPLRIKERNLSKEHAEKVFTMAKAEVTLNSIRNYDVDTVVMLDSDILPTPNIDHIFDEYAHQIENYPIFMKYAWNEVFVMGQSLVSEHIRKTIGISEPTIPSVCSCACIANRNCLSFLEDWVHWCNDTELFDYHYIRNKHIYFNYNDESIVNALLWKYKATKVMPCNFTWAWTPNTVKFTLDFYEGTVGELPLHESNTDHYRIPEAYEVPKGLSVIPKDKHNLWGFHDIKDPVNLQRSFDELNERF